jgi:hypothetical protein
MLRYNNLSFDKGRYQTTTVAENQTRGDEISSDQDKRTKYGDYAKNPATKRIFYTIK